MTTKPHRPTPPCNCDACRAATEAADVRRAEIAAALAAETTEGYYSGWDPCGDDDDYCEDCRALLIHCCCDDFDENFF